MNDNKQMDISPKSRSIRQIPLSRKEIRQESVPKKITEERRPIPPQKRSSNGMRKFIYLSAFLLAIFAILISTVFAAGRLTVNPKSETTLFDSPITAKAEGGDLKFETMTIEREASKDVAATGEAQVEERASGKIIVYNNQASAQKLITNTRFESDKGKIYRIRESITVPAKSTANGESTPGSVEVTVYADQPGESFNGGLSDFTLPGLKGSAQYDLVYGRSKTEMTGGFVGLKKTVSEADKTAARTELQEKLKADLFKEAASSKTDGYALFNDAMFVRFESLTDASSGNNVSIREKAILYGVMLDKKALSKLIAEKTISSYAGEDVLVENLEEMDFTTVGKETAEPWNTGEITFNLMGNPLIVWQFDEAKLKTDLVGKKKKEARAILTTYPSIERAEISLRPFWNSSFPKNADKIKIIKKINNEQ